MDRLVSHLPSSSQIRQSVAAPETSGWQKLPENKYEPLKIALVTRGPVAVAVAARGWEMYVNGVYSECEKDVATGQMLGVNLEFAFLVMSR